MEEKIYIVTLYKEEDLEQFYIDMEKKGIRLSLKRPLSRNTHYWMTEEQAEEIRQDPRVWAVQLLETLIDQSTSFVNNTEYNVSGTFWKNGSKSPTDFQWGHLHCAGTSTQRRKTVWGYGLTEEVTDSINVYNNGKHVDIVIVDNPVSKDCEEWLSPSTNQTRFVEYQWFNELNTYITNNQLDDDSITLDTGNITYHTNSNNPASHGNHVTGTAAGKHYGWARESNIYNLARGEGFASGQVVNSYLRFDYLRAFHRSKPINPITGKRNPTISNHSYGGFIPIPGESLQLNQIEYIIWRGNTYNSSNPGPAGSWTQENVEKFFGIRFGLKSYPSYNVAIIADVQQAVQDGIVVIGSAGNDSLLVASGPTDQDWNNRIKVSAVADPIYYNRGSWPNTPDSGAIVVGALSYYSRFYQAQFTNFGPGIDIFAPGQSILSTYNNTGLSDSKYSAGNYYESISGTSMASPQVCGVIALSASGKSRYTQLDARNYLNTTSIAGDMSFDFGINQSLSDTTDPGTFLDFTAQKGSPNLYLHTKNIRKTSGQLEEIKGERKSSGQVYPRRRYV